MHRWGIRLYHCHDINWLADWLGPIFGAKSKRAACLSFGHKYSIQSHVDHTNPRRKIPNEAGHAALEAVLAIDMKRDGRLLSRLDKHLLLVGGHQHIGGGSNRSKLQRRVTVIFRACCPD